MPPPSPGCGPADAAPDAVGRLCCQGMLGACVRGIGWNGKRGTEVSFQLFKWEEVVSFARMGAGTSTCAWRRGCGKVRGFR